MDKKIYDQQYYQQNRLQRKIQGLAYRERNRIDVPCKQCGIVRHLVESQYRYESKLPRYTGLCRKCAIGNIAGEKHPSWRGGRIKAGGYVLIKLQPNDFFYSMTDHQGYIPEHRLLVAQHLNRCLNKWEVVHHRNGIRADNRYENLELLPHSRFHLVDLSTKSYIRRLERKIGKLEELVSAFRG